MRWCPPLEGCLAEDALRAAQDIGDILVDWNVSDAVSYQGTSPADALADCALALSYLAEATGCERYLSGARRCVAASIEQLSRQAITSGLFGGIAGVGWTLAHLDGRRLDGDLGSRLASVDAALLSLVQRPLRPSDDLMSGIAGWLIYFVERHRTRGSQEGAITQLQDALLGRAQQTEAGLAWRGLAMSPVQSDAVFAVGMAHGTAGIIAALAQSLAIGCRTRECEAAVHSGARWLRQLPRTLSDERFPRWSGTNDGGAFFGWCWGDLGIASAMLLIGMTLREHRLARTGVAVAVAAATRRSVPPNDAGLCHGASGHAHICARLYNITRIGTFREAAQYWATVALHSRRLGVGVAGFDTVVPHQRRVSNVGFLMGVSGICLGLISLATPTLPSWDRRLGLSTCHHTTNTV